MKKFHTPVAYLVAMVFALQFLSSCSSVGITKMRYSRGYNLDIFASKNKQDKEEKALLAMSDSINKKNAARLAGNKKSVTPATEPESNVASVLVQSDESYTALDVEDNATRVATVASKDQKAAKVKPATARKAMKSALNESGMSYGELKHSVKEVVKENASKSNKSSDAPLILLVILALFPILSLIAVYLHDGGITTNFWITLILHFLFLYWLYALLVVLDVIDLA